MLNLLQGIRVVDLTTVVLGPYATQTLGDLGAEVIKVEPLSGDVFRAVRPGRSAGMGAAFMNCNRNKRALALDLSAVEGQAALHRLVAHADVVVHNMRPRSAAKLGIGFGQLVAVNPRLLYCYACGFGQEGRLADEPAYDDIIQAASGLAWLNAEAEGEPRFLKTIVADKVGGLHLAIAVLAALASTERKQGKPLCIEVPMFESMVSFLMVDQMGGYSFDPPMGGTGYDRLQSPFRKPFRTADGHVSIVPYTAAHWAQFLRLIGRDDMAEDPRVTNAVLRSRSADTLYAIIEEAAPLRTTDEWLAALSERGVPCAPANRIEDLFENGHLADVGMFVPEAHPEEGALLRTRSPFRVAGAEELPNLPAPQLGADSRALLLEAGLSEAEVEALVRSGAVFDSGGAEDAAAAG